MKTLSFVKMAGAGNDFIMADNRSGLVKTKLPELAKKLCDRKHSVGADGLILLERSKKADIRMRIFNPDGSEAEMCGNGVRCLAKFAVDKKIAKNKLSVETLAGLITAEVRQNTVKAKLMDPKDLSLGLSLNVNGGPKSLNFINTGVPHTVIVTESLEKAPVDSMGREIRFHSQFAPRGTNVNFISFQKTGASSNAIAIRTYERGVESETLACGTGSTAGALVAAALKGLKSPVSVKTEGGETLKVYFSKKDEKFYDVYLEGPVAVNFEGRVGL